MEVFLLSMSRWEFRCDANGVNEGVGCWHICGFSFWERVLMLLM